MSKFSDGDKLLDHLETNFKEALREELLVVDQFVSKVKLWLKSFPLIGILNSWHFEQDVFPYLIVESLSVGGVLSQSVDLHVVGIV